MSDFMIITDSTSDLGSSITAKHGIQVVPLKVTFGEEIMADGIDCTSELIFQRVKENGILPKTSAAAPAEFTQVFEPIIQSGKQVLYIGISSDFSSTIQNAHIAAADYPEGTVEIVDSRNLSTGIGLLVMKAVECKMQGLSLQQTAALLREMTDQVKTGFVIDTLEYLYKGGRLSSLSHLVGSMLKIKPFVRVVDGKMTVAEKWRGSGRKAVELMLARALEDKERIDPSRIFVTHADAKAEAEYIKERLKQEMSVQEVLITEAGSVIASHCGPGTVGILYIVKQ